MNRRTAFKLFTILPTLPMLCPTQPRPTFFICDGNSLTDTHGWNSGGLKSWVEHLDEDADTALRGVRFRNVAVAGQTTRDCINRAATHVDPLLRPKWRNIVFLWEIVNDLGKGASADEALQHVVEYCMGRKAAGFEVWVATMQPASPEPYGVASFEDKRVLVNDMLRQSWRFYADTLIDLAALPEFATNETGHYKADGVHLNASGEAVIAREVRAKLLNPLFVPVSLS